MNKLTTIVFIVILLDWVRLYACKLYLWDVDRRYWNQKLNWAKEQIARSEENRDIEFLFDFYGEGARRYGLTRTEFRRQFIVGNIK